MGKFDGVLLVSDFDDTLAGTGTTVSGENQRALRYFIAHGGLFSVATGRARPTFAPYVPQIPMNAPTILSNGAAIYDFSRADFLFESVLPARAASDFSALALALPGLAFEIYHGDDAYIYRSNVYSAAHMKKVRIGYTECAPGDIPQPWVKAILQQDYSLLCEAQRRVLTHWAEHYECIFSNRYLLEVTRRGCTKGGMVLRLAEMLGVSRGDIYCMGDNQNDLSMLEVSAIPFAPSNCAQEVRDWGARILGSCDEHCVAQAVALLDALYPGPQR